MSGSLFKMEDARVESFHYWERQLEIHRFAGDDIRASCLVNFLIVNDMEHIDDLMGAQHPSKWLSAEKLNKG